MPMVDGKFVVGDMNTYGVVYMSTVGRGTIVGAPEGTVVQGVKTVRLPNRISASMQLAGRNLFVGAPAGSRVILMDSKGRSVKMAAVNGSATVSLESLSAGTYFAKVISNHGAVLMVRKVSLK